MIISDLHLHSAFSTDGISGMEDMVKAAIDKGLKTIAITEHVDIDFPRLPEFDYLPADEPLFMADVDAYKKEVERLREIYGEKLEILFGIELGLMRTKKAEHDAYVQKYDFDFIIGSSHVVADYGGPEEERYFVKAGTEEKGYRVYFESILENIKLYPFIHTYAHLDYVIRYGPNQNKFYSYKKYADIIDAILDELIKRDIALELNTSGWHYGLGQPHPHGDILKRYYEKGGRMITIGSDAHSTDRIAKYFDKAEELLKSTGFKEYCIIRKGKAEQIGF